MKFSEIMFLSFSVLESVQKLNLTRPEDLRYFRGFVILYKWSEYVILVLVVEYFLEIVFVLLLCLCTSVISATQALNMNISSCLMLVTLFSEKSLPFIHKC